jgi:predicted transcriptional regulator
MVNALNRLNEKMDTLVNLDTKILKINEVLLEKISSGDGLSKELSLSSDALSILSLPLALRKTIMALYKLEKATAEDIARETNRLRAVERAAANELARMGYVKKKREGRNVLFYIDLPQESSL